MTGRRAAIGLSLLCALLFSAFGAQGAAAAGTTAFTCAPQAAGGAGFSDAHCDNAVASNATFAHKEISGTVSGKTHIHTTNKQTASSTTAATSAVFTLKNYHGFTEVKSTCTEVTTVGATGVNVLSDVEIGGVMQAEGRVEVKYSSAGGNCTTNVPKCSSNFGNLKAKFLTVEPAATEMGVKFEPDVGDTFSELTYEGVGCPLNGVKIPIKGSYTTTSPAGANGGGATWVVTPAMSNLSGGGIAMELSQTTTAKMTTNTTEEAAIALTTTTP